MKHSPQRFDVDSLSEDIRECYQLAADCARRAKAEADPQLRQDFLDMERRWLFLARSYELTRQLGLPRRRERHKTQGPGLKASRALLAR